MRILTASDVARLLPHSRCIPAMRDVMQLTSERGVVLPLRQFMNVPGTAGKLGLMPGYMSRPAAFGVKIVSKFPRAPGAAHGSHVGAVLLFDAVEGLPLALLDGGMLTAIRTASTTAMATDALARPDARRLLLVGCGEEAEHHLAALREVRAFERCPPGAAMPAAPRRSPARMSRRHGRPVEAVADLAAAVAGADVICTVTSAATPILHGEWLRPGQHVNLVGSAIATTAEADSGGGADAAASSSTIATRRWRRRANCSRRSAAAWSPRPTCSARSARCWRGGCRDASRPTTSPSTSRSA